MKREKRKRKWKTEGTPRRRCRRRWRRRRPRRSVRAFPWPLVRREATEERRRRGESGRKRSNEEGSREREGTASFRFLMLRRGLHQPVARLRSHKNLEFEKQPPSRVATRFPSTERISRTWRCSCDATPRREPSGTHRVNWPGDARNVTNQPLAPTTARPATREGPSVNGNARTAVGPAGSGPVALIRLRSALRGPTLGQSCHRTPRCAAGHEGGRPQGLLNVPLQPTGRGRHARSSDGSLKGCSSIHRVEEDVPLSVSSSPSLSSSSPSHRASSSATWRRTRPTRRRRVHRGNCEGEAVISGWLDVARRWGGWQRGRQGERESVWERKRARLRERSGGPKRSTKVPIFHVFYAQL